MLKTSDGGQHMIQWSALTAQLKHPNLTETTQHEATELHSFVNSWSWVNAVDASCLGICLCLSRWHEAATAYMSYLLSLTVDLRCEACKYGNQRHRRGRFRKGHGDAVGKRKGTVQRLWPRGASALVTCYMGHRKNVRSVCNAGARKSFKFAGKGLGKQVQMYAPAVASDLQRRSQAGSSRYGDESWCTVLCCDDRNRGWCMLRKMKLSILREICCVR